jgi:hypothetical protein
MWIALILATWVFLLFVALAIVSINKPEDD